MIDLTWMDGALCAQPGVDRSIFFPVGEDRCSVNAARTICFRCPLRVPCRDHALRYHEDGVWGGTTDYERRQIRKGLISA